MRASLVMRVEPSEIELGSMDFDLTDDAELLALTGVVGALGTIAWTENPSGPVASDLPLRDWRQVI